MLEGFRVLRGQKQAKIDGINDNNKIMSSKTSSRRVPAKMSAGTTTSFRFYFGTFWREDGETMRIQSAKSSLFQGLSTLFRDIPKKTSSNLQKSTKIKGGIF
jgi:hypothetical protein